MATTTTRRARKTTTAAAPTEPTAPEATITEPTTTEPTADPIPTADPTPAEPTADPDTDATTTDQGDGGDAIEPVSAVPVSPAPVGSADHMKIVMVAGVLGDHPQGVPAATVADESGLRAGIVGRVLAAMEIAGAAVRKPADTEGGAEVWLRGEADLTTVDLARADEPDTCPTCHRRMPRRGTVAVRRGPAAPGQNGDGQATLAKNGLRDIVKAFLAEHPGHEFTAGTIAKELTRSSGAVGNALARLTATGEAVLVKEAPMTYTAPAAKPATTTEDTTTTTDAAAGA